MLQYRSEDIDMSYKCVRGKNFGGRGIERSKAKRSGVVAVELFGACMDPASN